MQEVIEGSKHLLKKSEVKMLSNVPKLMHLPCEDLWASAKRDPKIARYLPTGSAKYTSKEFLLNVDTV